MQPAPVCATAKLLKDGRGKKSEAAFQGEQVTPKRRLREMTLV